MAVTAEAADLVAAVEAEDSAGLVVAAPAAVGLGEAGSCELAVKASEVRNGS